MLQGGYIFAGGGTGGHLTPALALADALRVHQPEAPVRLLGSDRPIEQAFLAGSGLEQQSLQVSSLSQLLQRPLRGVLQMRRAVAAAKDVLQRQRPWAVIGCGGFASVPTVWAAWRLGIPIVLLEQNVLPGRATRWLSRLADRVCLSFEESRHWLPGSARTVVTGNPVRREFADMAIQPPAPADEGPGARPLLLVLGGSLGARGVNQAILQGLSSDDSQWTGWRIVHQTGASESESIRAAYAERSVPAEVQGFIPPSDLVDLMRRASIVVTRAGATTLAELSCCGVPTIAVPWAHSADRHQDHNARWYAERGAVLSAADELSTPRDHSSGKAVAPLWDCVRRLLSDSTLRRELSMHIRAVARPEAAAQVMSEVLQCARAR